MRSFDSLSENEISPSPSRRKRKTPHLRGHRRGAQGDLPGHGRDVSPHAGGGGNGHRQRLIEIYRAALRRTHPAHPQAGYPRLRPPPAGVADAAAGHRPRAQTGRVDGDGDAAVLRSRDEAHDRRRHPRIARRPRRRGARRTPIWRRSWKHEQLTAGCAQARRRSPPAAVRAASRAARPGRVDGRLGLDAGAAVRGGVRHAQQHAMPSASAWPPRSAPASAWASPRRCPTTARSPAAATRGCAASSAG